MNTIPRHVILDLLPLYMADELSPETRRLVEEYLLANPDFASGVNAVAADSPIGFGPKRATLDPELATIHKTRSMLALQRWMFGLAIGFIAVGLSLSVSITNGRVSRVHLMARDFPVEFGACLVIGAGLWLGYYSLRRRMSA